MKYGDFKLSKELADKFFSKEDIDMSGYESPIKIVIGQMRVEQENNTFKAVQECGVDVNKEELEKALRYDRDQYRKGYADGYDDGYYRKASDVALEVITEVETVFDEMIDEATDQLASARLECDLKAVKLMEYAIDVLHLAYRTLKKSLKKKYTEG